MFDEMPLGIGALSRARAGLVATVFHLTIVCIAVFSTRGSAVPMSRPPLDTVRIELPRAPTTQTVPHDAPREQLPLMPQAPAVPPLPMIPSHAARVKLDSPKLDHEFWKTIRSMLTGQSNRESSPDDTAMVGAAEADHLPELIGELKPHYPDELRRAGLSGETLLEYVIDGEGRVVRGSIHIIRSTYPAFARSAIESVIGARFKPARRAGRSIPVVVRQRIRFESHESF